ncbi:MAG: hypothetical protein AAF849_20050 [Bacteroidota bacterium]
MLEKSLLSLVFCLVLFACASPNEEETVLKEAHEIHMEAIRLNESVQPKLEQMSEMKSELKANASEMGQEASVFVKAVEQIEKSYKYWESNHVEVPGFEHEGHDHSHHDHEHDHGPSIEVSASDMLIIQQEFRDTLTSIAERLDRLEIPNLSVQ